MKKWTSVFLALVLVLVSASAALAAGKLNVEQENFMVIDSYSSYAYCFAKVKNTGNKPITVNAGVMEVYDANSDVITSSDYLSRYARVLQPDEYTYVSINKDIEDPDSVTKPYDYMLTVTGKTDEDSTTERLPVEFSLSLDETNGYWTEDYMYATVTNNTEETKYNISVVFALLDAEGNILYVDNDDLYRNRGLTPGSSIVIRKEIPSSFMEYFEANKIVPTAVDAIAYIDN